nr:NADH dehydrogenase subunit 4 [Gyrodactylus sp. FZ-2021]
MILWQIFPLSIVYIIIILLTSLLNNNIIIFDYFIFDNLSLFLGMLPLFLFYGLLLFFYLNLSYVNIVLIFLSCIFSFLCFFCSSYILFFIFYECSIIFLLFSLFLGSPYSERSLAGWYFLGYLMFGGIPLLLLCIFCSFDNYSCIISDYLGVSNVFSYLFFLIFITKVPLFPFHSWLPIVHAEANSFVSIMLSGYIMKLGLIGLHRFFYISGEYLKFYIVLFLFFSIFFFLSCFVELDNKRWLAFLSLGHICIGMLSIFSLDSSYSSIIGLFSLGHGISVSIMFYYFFISAEYVGSRNWILIILNNNSIYNLVLVFGILTLIAFPPCILFFCEVYIYISIMSIMVFIVLFSFYILFSMFGPIFILGLLLSRLSFSYSFLVFNSSYYYLFSAIFIFFFIGLFL